jgi:hypothetical protein
MEQKRTSLTWKTGLLLAVIGVALVAAFALSPIPDPDDWITFFDTGQRVLHGAPLYGQATRYSVFSNPPWLAVLLAPLSLLPMRWGWAALSALSLALALAIARRWRTGPVRLALVLLSPAMLYIVMHGQVDALVLGGVLLPSEWRLLVGLTKPQVSLGLIFGVGRSRILRAAALSGVVYLLSFAVFGNWPVQLLRQPAPFVYATHNLWLGLWPFQVPAGVALIALGLRRRDERLLVAASPFFTPYAATSSLIGPWLAFASILNDWEAGLVWMAWWGAVLYRYLIP